MGWSGKTEDKLRTEHIEEDRKSQNSMDPHTQIDSDERFYNELDVRLSACYRELDSLRRFLKLNVTDPGAKVAIEAMSADAVIRFAASKILKG
jgi:hypothetical protein